MTLGMGRTGLPSPDSVRSFLSPLWTLRARTDLERRLHQSQRAFLDLIRASPTVRGVSTADQGRMSWYSVVMGLPRKVTVR